MIPISYLSSKLVSNVYTAETTSSEKWFLYPDNNFEFNAVPAHFKSIFLFYSVLVVLNPIERSLILYNASFRAVL